MPPHGGFALGLERFMAQALGLGNVRETTLFPRDRNRLQP
jgi:nondiscriminating aspartyl-tRNA synthetase